MSVRLEPIHYQVPASALLLARRGTAYFSRKLNELPDDEFGRASLLPGWSRSFVIAHVGYNARAIHRLVQWAHTGIEVPMYASLEERLAEIEYGATLTPAALRHLHHHACVALDVAWRDLEETSWSAEVRTVQNRLVPVRETIWMRTREVWLHAVDLDNGGRITDFPPRLVDLLLADIVRSWERQGLSELPRFAITDRPQGGNTRDGSGSPRGPLVRGRATEVLAWASGRAAEESPAVHRWGQPPRWL